MDAAMPARCILWQAATTDLSPDAAMTDAPPVFINAALAGARFTDTRFRDATFEGCDIDGLPVADLPRAYRQSGAATQGGAAR